MGFSVSFWILSELKCLCMDWSAVVPVVFWKSLRYNIQPIRSFQHYILYNLSLLYPILPAWILYWIWLVVFHIFLQFYKIGPYYVLIYKDTDIHGSCFYCNVLSNGFKIFLRVSLPVNFCPLKRFSDRRDCCSVFRCIIFLGLLIWVF